MSETFYRHIDIDPDNCFILNGKNPDLQKECDDFEEKIKACGGIELFIAGLFYFAIEYFLYWMQCKRVWLEKQLDCAHPLVLNNGAPISWARSIMSVYDEATPYGDTSTLPSVMKFPEAIGARLFNGNGWANTSLIQSEPLFAWLCRMCKSAHFYLSASKGTASKVSMLSIFYVLMVKSCYGIDIELL